MALSTQAIITVLSSPKKASKTRDSGTNLTTWQLTKFQHRQQYRRAKAVTIPNLNLAI
jgi:hypothetical protein